MEEQKYQTFLDPIIQLLEKLHDKLRKDIDGDLEGFPLYFRMDWINYINGPIKTMGLEMRLFKMFFWGLAYWDIDLEYDWHLQSAVNVLFPKLSQTANEFVEFGHQYMNWEELNYDLMKRIKESKVQAKEICIHLLNGGFKCKSYQLKEMKSFLTCVRDTLCFMNFIQQNLEAYPNSDIAPIIDLVRQQFVFIQWKLEGFGNFNNPIDHSIIRVKYLYQLISCTRTWVNQISCLVFLHLIDGMHESQASAIKIMVSDLIHKTRCFTPGIVASNIEPTVVPQLLSSYIDFLLKILVERLMTLEFENLCGGLIFLLSFVVHPPEQNSIDKERILARTYVIINELPSLFRSIFRSDEMKGGICKDTILDYLKKIDAVKVEAGDIYVMRTVGSSNFNSPKTNPIGFLDSLLETLKKMLEVGHVINLIPFTKHQIEIVREDLGSIRPFLQNNIDLFENDQDGELIKDFWIRTVDMVYYTSYVTTLYSGNYFPIWYSMLGLPNVVKEIKLIKTQIKTFEDHLQILKNRRFILETNVALPQRATTSTIEGAFIGFQEDVRSIIDYLLRGQKDRMIVSISGMPGQGKTTLAKKIFNDPSVEHHFHKKVWSYVSKECTMRELLLRILHELVHDEKEYKSLLTKSDPDLAERLRKSLKGQRYLIMLDDVWDVVVWHQVQGSFPNDGNGSRILFTSRNHDLASQAKLNSISYRLRLLSDEESWELMKKNLFQCDSCPPPEILEIGKRIAICCKGLPLAMSLMAAVLMRIEQKVDLWIQIAETLKSHLASEGCGNIIELSYKNLSDHLKPCFLYFGAFPRGENILAKKLKLLWIAEGFINNDNDKKQSSEDLASSYLSDLVSQSLVVVTEMNSMGGIKSCNVHDLIYDLCLEKTAEENFLHWTEENIVIDRSGSQKFTHHRLCIGKTDPLIKPSPIITREELLTCQVHSLLWVSQSRSTIDHLVEFLENFKVLKLLDLNGNYPEVIEKTLEIIVPSNIHLRYLALEVGCSSPCWLSASIANLWSLEILIISAYGRVSLPTSLWKMKSLRHVDITYYFHFDWEDFDDGENNSSFAAYDIEELGCILLAYNNQTEEFLKKLQKLRELRCLWEGPEFHPMWFSMLRSLTNLESLRVVSVLNIEFSTINFPKIENLKELTLSGGHLIWSVLSEIGKQLPNLQVLKLLYGACSGHIWDLEDDNFSKLIYLELHELNIQKINFSLCDDPFPCLEELVVDQCPRLEEIPSNFGDICTLNIIKLLRVSKCKRSVQKVLKKQRENGNHGFRVIGQHFDDEVEEEEEDEDDEDGHSDDENDKEED